MILNEENAQNNLKKQQKMLLKENTFTPYLKWAPDACAKFKRLKQSLPKFCSRNNSLLKCPSLDISKLEHMISEDSVKDELDRGRNLIRKYKTSEIESIAERDEESYESDKNEEYQKDSATTASSAGNKTEHNRIRKEKELI
eukprot:TRINITY_DN11332_c0_g3_i1.p2 TRINITY_DN11332_c0_g3~~TRINITY_DN11332_c0_g3_i1.p2  ORF type:complete len:142 (-),score=52.04 TRINITY_DN11332_c0_g3_i1:82-507(-)